MWHAGQDDEKQESELDRKGGGPSCTTHIDTALNNPPIQFNTGAYVAYSLKSSVLNLYDWCSHKLLHESFSLWRLADASHKVFIARHPIVWT